MGERVSLTVKKPEMNRYNSNSRMRRTNHSRSVGPLVDRMVFLQRTVGNQAVQRLMKSKALQAKLSIGQPGDKYEQEADRVADAVMRMPEPGVQRQVEPEEEEEEEILQTKLLVDQITPLVQRQVEEEEEEEEMLQAKSREDAPSEVTDDLESQINAIKGGGRPLAESERAYFEPRFGADFSQVKVHTDMQADESTRVMNAKAYTLGQDVVFGAGQYAPGTSEGRRLMAHELTHVVQQNGNEFRVFEQRIQLTAASCPANWSTTVSADHNRALGMIDSARQKLSSYNGTTPAEVRTALQRHFKATSTGFAGWVNFNLGFLRLMAPLADYDCEDTSSWWCGSNTLAKTFWCVPGIDIRVCQPLYFAQSNRERSATLIHEWVHKYGCNFDLGYSHESDYPSQWTITALLNADPFSEFIKDVQ